MGGFLQWLKGLWPRRVRVRLDGPGYRVNDTYCATQVEVREQLEALGLEEQAIIQLLQELNREKYGNSQR